MTGDPEGTRAGMIKMISGPVVKAKDMSGAKMYDVVTVGTEKLMGEIIELDEDVATIQVYEETAGISPGEIVEMTNEPLSVELGPGLMSMIYDGIQRPLESIMEQTGDFIRRGVSVLPLDHEKKWTFNPSVKIGDRLLGGDIIGWVLESPTVKHYIMVPPETEGVVGSIAPVADYNIDHQICTLTTSKGDLPIKMFQRCPVVSELGRP